MRKLNSEHSIPQQKNKQCKSMVSPNPQLLKFRNLLYYTAKVLALFLKLFFLFIFSTIAAPPSAPPHCTPVRNRNFGAELLLRNRLKKGAEMELVFNQKQYVSVYGFNSDVESINYGVAQRSILGPLLFLLYINDLGNSVNCLPRLFLLYYCRSRNE